MTGVQTCALPISALYALRANKKVLILEKECYGGQIINASNIENYPDRKSVV